LKITTYNMLFGGKEKTHWSRVVADHDPDVFLVQETYAPHEHLSGHGDLHQHAAWSPVAGQAWGSAVYVKSTIRCQITIPVAEFAGWVVGVEVDGLAWSGANGRRLRIFSVHAPKIGSYQKAVNSVLNMIHGLTDGADVVIGGDFNLTISQRQATESRKTSKKDSAIQNRLRDEFGLVNCWQSANPSKWLDQTLRWQNAPKTPYHCDGIFVPKAWEGRLQSSGVLSGGEWNDLSDHNPVVAEFD